MKKTVSRTYADVCSNFDAEIFEFKNFTINYTNPHNYTIKSYIGKGRYSLVFIGKHQSQKVIIKTLRPVPPYKINRELTMLTNLCHPNIVKLLDITIDPQNEFPSLIFEYMPYKSTRDVLMTASLSDMRVYFKQVLSALDFAHSRGIMHRDLKPHNIIIDPSTKKIKIIDWGLADFYLPQHKYNCKVGTRYYKAIELLVGYPYYDYSVDIWSAGLIFYEGCLNTCKPFFSGSSDDNQVDKIVKIMGTGPLLHYLKMYDIDYPRKKVYEKNYIQHQPFNVPSKSDSEVFDSWSARDLVSEMVVYDHTKRVTAAEALQHPFFTVEDGKFTTQ